MRGSVERGRRACPKLGREESQRNQEAWWFVVIESLRGMFDGKELSRDGDDSEEISEALGR